MTASWTIGFDPGGKHAFGWAVLERRGVQERLIAHGVASDAVEAVEAAADACDGDVAAVGIDAPLFWVPRGDRHSDRFVRRLVCGVGGSAGTVAHVNSLRGACLVQGILAARFVVKRWPRAQLTEAHPKALLRVSASARAFVERVASECDSEHARDAALAAFAGAALVDRLEGWSDLVSGEAELFFPAGQPVAYWFPDRAELSVDREK